MSAKIHIDESVEARRRHVQQIASGLHADSGVIDEARNGAQGRPHLIQQRIMMVDIRDIGFEEGRASTSRPDCLKCFVCIVIADEIRARDIESGRA
jgi:hypothetical protein